MRYFSFLPLFFLLNIQILKAQDEESFKQLVVPTSGVWWNSEQGGTGATMDFSRDGKWFVSLFLYDESGAPIFYTLQGNSIDYSFDKSSFTDNDIITYTINETNLYASAYAKIESDVYKSSNGRCLGCEYQPPVTAIIPDVHAEVFFYQKGIAKIKFTGGITFEEVIKNNLFTENIPLDANKRHHGYALNSCSTDFICFRATHSFKSLFGI